MADQDKNGPGEGHNSKAIEWAKVAKILKSDLAAARDKGAKVRGDQSALWKRVEEMGAHKAAAKVAFRLQGQSASEVSLYLRTLVMLLEPLGLGVLEDMVDVAEGKTGLEIPLIKHADMQV